MRDSDTRIKSEFAAKRETALAINKQLQREAKAIKCWLVAQCEISDTTVRINAETRTRHNREPRHRTASANRRRTKTCLSQGQLRCELNQPVRSAALTCFLTSAAHPRANNRAVQLWQVLVHIWELFGCRGLPLPLSRALHQRGPELIRALGQARFRHPNGKVGRRSTRFARRPAHERAPRRSPAPPRTLNPSRCYTRACGSCTSPFSYTSTSPPATCSSLRLSSRLQTSTPPSPPRRGCSATSRSWPCSRFAHRRAAWRHRP